jgi:hypothetical protein
LNVITKTIATIKEMPHRYRDGRGYWLEHAPRSAICLLLGHRWPPAETGLGFLLRGGLCMRCRTPQIIRKIATWIPATQESLDDVPFLESSIRDLRRRGAP